MSRSVRLWVMGLLAFCTAACSRSVEPGLYQVKDGFLRVGIDSAGCRFAVLYRDAGDRWADTLQLDPSALQRDLKPYEEPEFHLFPERTLYLAPVYEVGETRDIVYGRVLRNASAPEADMQNLTLDLYYPRKDGASLRPLLVMLHGGAFQGGDKQDPTLVEWCRYFASLGYVVSSVNYRLSPCRKMEEADTEIYHAVKDANASVRFLLKRDSLLIHPGQIFAGGLDAGAVTALNLAYMREENLPEIIQDEEDTVLQVRQPLLRGFEVRAVANLWGAAVDTAMLHNARIPVISYQSRNDPEIAFGVGYPYEQQEREEPDGLGAMLREALEAILSVFQPEFHTFRRMYGAGEIDRILQAQGTISELHAFDYERHDLFTQEDGAIDYLLFEDARQQVARFFAGKMETAPVSLRPDPEDAQLFLIDATEVDECLWKVEGGAILGKSSDALRVLFFPDAPVHSVSVSGTYTSGMTFNETVRL